MFENMIPNFKMGFYHQKEYLERPCGIQMSEKLVRRTTRDTMDGFEYSSLFASKTYSILSYIVGGFVGSKSQMNNNKHNLSYDLSAAVFNLLNPCRYEREKSGLRKGGESNLHGAARGISAEGYDKYIVKSSQRDEKMLDLELELLAALPILEQNLLGLNQESYTSSQSGKGSFDCDERKSSDDAPTAIEGTTLEDSLCDSVNVTDRVSIGAGGASGKENSSHSVNYLATERFRQQSECSVESTDSESFIIFDNADIENDEAKEGKCCFSFETFDMDSEDGNEESCDDDSSCEYDICSLDKELAEANDKWWKSYENVETSTNEEQKKVRFSDDVKINKIVAWDFAYRAARPGPWEQMARDRVRFRERILRLSPTISPVLRKEHRERVYKDLYS